MTDLTLTLVQSDLQWQAAEANRQLLEQQMAEVPPESDLIILPEMFTSAFSTDARSIAEDYPGETLPWMLDQARKHNAALTGSVAVRMDGQRYNRLLFVTPQQDVHYYDKRHLFRMMQEHKRYGAGREKILVQWRGWRIMPLVCYDLRFPVWSRNTAAAPYDLLLYVANWPAARRQQWSRLLRARAIENLSYVAGVNRVGTDGNGVQYDGHSAVCDPLGDELLQAADQAGIFSITLSKRKLDDFRKSFPAHMDADEFTIRA